VVDARRQNVAKIFVLCDDVVMSCRTRDKTFKHLTSKLLNLYTYNISETAQKSNLPTN